MYSDCGDGDTTTLTVAVNAIMGYTDGEEISYDPWCPCFDGEGSNTGNAELAVFGGELPVTSTGSPSDAPIGGGDDEDSDSSVGGKMVGAGVVGVAGAADIAVALEGIW